MDANRKKMTMKKTVLGSLGAVAIAIALQFTMANVQAGLFNSCTPCDEVACFPCDDSAFCDPCDAVCGPRVKAGKWFLSGHMEAGFFANAYGQKSTYGDAPFRAGRGADVGSGNTALLYNTRLTGAQVNQVYLSAGKKVDGRHGLDLGGRVDFTWGSDAFMVQALGMEETAKDPAGWGSGDYYASFAQAYAELAYGRWNIVAGKFYAPFGSNPYSASDRFFYTMDQNYVFLPHTAGGAYASYKVNQNLVVIAGWAMPEEFGHCTNNNAVLGGLVWNANKVNLRYAFGVGRSSCPLLEGESVDVFVQSVIATTQISRKLRYVVDWSFINATLVGGGTEAIYGINNELIYQSNDKWAFGTRFGVLNANANAAPLFGEDAAAGEWYTVSLGANWTPNEWLVVKPEIRYDWMDPDGNKPFNGGAKHTQFSGGMSAVVKF